MLTRTEIARQIRNQKSRRESYSLRAGLVLKNKHTGNTIYITQLNDNGSGRFSWTYEFLTGPNKGKLVAYSEEDIRNDYILAWGGSETGGN